MIKKGSKKDMINFLQMPNKLSSKKRRQINKSKRKTSIKGTSLRKAIISNLNSSDIKELPVPISAIKTLKSKAQNIYIAMIDADTYRIACCIKKAQVFTVYITDIQYQAEKEAKAETNTKSIILQEYYNLFDIFSKKDSDILFLHQKYDQKIYLEKKQKPGHVLLNKISPEELNAVKWYLDSLLAKRFIQASLAFYSLPVLFMKKPRG